VRKPLDDSPTPLQPAFSLELDSFSRSADRTDREVGGKASRDALLYLQRRSEKKGKREKGRGKRTSWIMLITLSSCSWSPVPPHELLEKEGKRKGE